MEKGRYETEGYSCFLKVTPRCISYVLKTYTEDDNQSKKSNSGGKYHFPTKSSLNLKLIDRKRFKLGLKLAKEVKSKLRNCFYQNSKEIC